PALPPEATSIQEKNGLEVESPGLVRSNSESSRVIEPPEGATSSDQLRKETFESALPPEGSFKAIQLYDTYLVLETVEGMLVIDQHALHERILFEALKKRLQSGPLETQKLLIPEPVDLSDEAAARTLECQEALRDLGLEVSDFGGSTILLSS